MPAEVALELDRAPGEGEAAVRDAVGIGQQRETSRVERVARAFRCRAEQVAAFMPQRADRAAEQGQEPELPPRMAEERGQPTISSSSRPRVSCTSARTKKKETSALRA